MLQKSLPPNPELMTLTLVVRFHCFLVQLLLSKYATERWINFLSHRFSVRALTLPWKTLRP